MPQSPLLTPLPLEKVDSNILRSSTATPAYSKYLLYSLISIGILFRLFHFFNNRSLFIDELYLDINLIKMNFWELATLPLQYEQKAPLGYLWSVKALVLLFGKGEKALRLFSLLCGISSLFFFITVARYYLKSWGVVLAVGIMALSTSFVYHSVEAKQYSTELLTSVLALLLYVRYHRSAALPDLLKWGIGGALLLWFSFSLVFILAGIASVVCLEALMKKHWKRFFSYCIPFLMWAVSFGFLYYFFLSKYPQSGWLIDFFAKEYDGFMPLPPSSFADIIWFFQKPYSLLDHPLGSLLKIDSEFMYPGLKHILKLGWAQCIIILFGAVVLLRKNKFEFFILLLPIIITFLASGLKLYPIYGRFMLFLTPLILIILGCSVEKMMTFKKYGKSLLAFSAFALLAPPLINSTAQVVNPKLFQGNSERETILFVNDKFREGDAVYVFWNMRHAYGYYKESYDLKYTATLGSYVKNTSSNAKEYIQNLGPDFTNFKGKKRLWFIYDPGYKNDIGEYVGQPAWYHAKDFSPDQAVEQELAKLGKKIKQYKDPINGLTVSLFELNE